MKIVNRNTFLTMPSGLLFQKYSKTGNLGDLEIKACTPGKWTPDFLSVQLTSAWPKGPDNSDQFVEKWANIENGESFTFEYEIASRDGLYEEDQLFCVYDKEDVEALIKQLTNLINN